MGHQASCRQILYQGSVCFDGVLFGPVLAEKIDGRLEDAERAGFGRTDVGNQNRGSLISSFGYRNQQGCDS